MKAHYSDDSVQTISSAVALRDPMVVKLEEARTALMEATDLSEVKHIHDVAAAWIVYARRQQLGDDAIAYGHRVKIEALAKLGVMLGPMPKNVGAKGSVVTGTKQVPVRDTTPTLKELGLTKKESAQARQLAALPAREREAIAARETTLTKALRAANHAKRREAPELPTDQYRVFYADPPWSYGDSGLQQYGHASHHYPSMTIEELCALPVAERAEADAVLFLWVTSPLLEDAFRVVEAWGFEYKASIVWNKDAHNFGHYVSVRHEFLLICVRGSCTPDIKELLPSVVTIKRAKHSEKPEVFRAMIDKMYPKGKRIELFARGEAAAGWETWGNEPL